MVSFRMARTDDALDLSRLAYNSEAYLGYDSDYMNRFGALYNVSKEFIDSSYVYIMDDNNKTVGFWGLFEREGMWELEFFYITPESIGKGFGRLLWGTSKNS